MSKLTVVKSLSLGTQNRQSFATLLFISFSNLACHEFPLGWLFLTQFMIDTDEFSGTTLIFLANTIFLLYFHLILNKIFCLATILVSIACNANLQFPWLC